MSTKQFIPGIKYGNQVSPDEIQSGSQTASTNGTTAVSLFGSAGLSGSATIQAVTVMALDTTAGNITVENPAGTVVATVAKGTTAGVLTGAVTLANTAVAIGTNVIIKSSSAGNATVTVTLA